MGTTSGRDVLSHLHHRDPVQLLYQVQEIVGNRLYLQHGITVSPGDVVLDVGANVGVAAAFFAVECGATVHSFEPIAPTFDDLCETIRELPTCRAHNVAVGAGSGTAEITYYPRADAMSGLYADPDADRELTRACLVNAGMDPADADARVGDLYQGVTMTCIVRTLSDVLADLGIGRVDLLKVDVERAELDVLRGIRDNDWPRVRQLVLEVHDEEGRLAAVTGILEARGFHLVVDQDPVMAGTGLYVVYATRPAS